MKKLIAAMLAVISLSAAAETCHYSLVAGNYKKIDTMHYYDSWQKNDCRRKAMKACLKKRDKLIELGRYYEEELVCFVQKRLN